MSYRAPSYGLNFRQQSRAATALCALLALTGCGSVSVLGGADDPGPAITSSVAAVEVQQPLPQRLAYSDATKIGQAAAMALRDVDASTDPAGGEGADWVNAATGSSGTLTNVKQEDSGEVSRSCRLFNTIVTSFSGVHRYSGRICGGEGGRPVVQLSDSETVGDS